MGVPGALPESRSVLLQLNVGYCISVEVPAVSLPMLLADVHCLSRRPGYLGGSGLGCNLIPLH